jgi:hypothetical protein
MATDNVFFYYSKTVPQNSVAIANIQARASSPSDLVGINNSVPAGSLLAPGAYTATGYPVARVANGLALGNAVSIHNSLMYLVKDQFFELTNVTDGLGNPLFYQHPLPAGVTGATVLNLDLTPASGFVVQNGVLYHSLDGSAKWVRYYSNRMLYTELLQYTPALTAGLQTSASTYIYSHSVIEVNDTGAYWIRWMADSGYRVLPPYNALPNDPWYARVRFNPNPGAPEWGRQLFTPMRPYQAASWVPGTVIDPHIVEFERRPMYFDGSRYPDILIYDQNYNLKYAIDGSPINTPARKGYLYPWKRSQYAAQGLDPSKGRANLLVSLDPTDICFGFYFYAEPDIVYRELDLNPFTNPAIAGRTIEFFYKPNTTNPYQNVYHRLLNSDGTFQGGPGATNDPVPSDTSGAVFSTVLVNNVVPVSNFSYTDARSPGGGLAPAYQAIDASVNFWDLGYLDGKPYPLGGAAVIYLPASLVSSGDFTNDELQAVADSVLPLGTIPILRFYDAAGNESV